MKEEKAEAEFSRRATLSLTRREHVCNSARRRTVVCGAAEAEQDVCVCVCIY